MDELRIKLEEVFRENPTKFVISNPKAGASLRKVMIRLITLRGEVVYQIERFTEKQAFHENLQKDALVEAVLSIMQDFRQMDVWTESFQYAIKISKKGKVLSNRHKIQGGAVPVPVPLLTLRITDWRVPLKAACFLRVRRKGYLM